MTRADFFTHNRDSLRAALNGMPAVFIGHGQLQRKRDTTFSFVQESNFWYLSGIDEPDCILYIGEQGGDDFLIAPTRSSTQETFDGAVNIDSLKNTSGLKHIFSEREGWNLLVTKLEKQKKYYTPRPARAFDVASRMYTNPAAHRTLQKIQRKCTGVTYEDVRPLLAQLRMIKSEYEVAQLTNAIDITCTALSQISQNLSKGRYRHEYQIEADLTRAFRFSGATGHAYSPIVGAGHNATVLHYVRNDMPLTDGSLVVIDVGAEYQNYAADITRTYAVGNLSSRQQAVYDAVLRIQNNAIDRITPGVTFRDFEDMTRKMMARELVGLGLITSEHDIDGVLRYFPHATTHFLGLDVHDVGDYTAPLSAGMVITCEPGIYIPEESIGVRIEDDILVTEKGRRNLSSACPK